MCMQCVLRLPKLAAQWQWQVKLASASQACGLGLALNDCFAGDAGLDSSSAAGVVDILSGLAQAGMTVLLTIHQPRPDVSALPL